MNNPNPDRPALISAYRSDEDIRSVLQEICDRPAAVDEPGRLHALTILDDLAEEMIGRSQAADPNLKIRIRDQRVRWAGPGSADHRSFGTLITATGPPA